MAELADRLAALRITATSADHRITAIIRGNRQMTITFAARSYAGYTDTELARQLTYLATTGAAAHTRETRHLLRVHARSLVNDDLIELGPERRRFRQRAEQLVTEATSARGTIRIVTRALLRWNVTIADSTTRSLNEKEFLEELKSVVARALTRHRQSLFDLKYEAFGDPPWASLLRQAGP